MAECAKNKKEGGIVVGRNRIRNLLMKLNDEDRNTLCCLLVKAGYAVRIGKERPGGKGQTMYFVEFWEESGEARQDER